MQKIILLYFALALFYHVSAQSVSFDINTWCVKSNDCNPFLNQYVCKTAIIQATHGSPAFYLPTTNSTREIELFARVASDGTYLGEGFTLVYPFKTGKQYTVKITHSGIANTTALFPHLIAALTNDPPRHNDGCDLGALPSSSVYTSYTFTVSALPAVTSSFTITPSMDVGFLWLRSEPSITDLNGLLIYKIEIIDAANPPPPPPPPPPTSNCDFADGYKYCSNNFEGWFSFHLTKPVTINCDGLKSNYNRPSDNSRLFYVTNLTLAPGFYAIPDVNTEYFYAVASATPCAVSIAKDSVNTRAIPIKNTVNENEQTENTSGEILVYPSPTNGMVTLEPKSNEINLKRAEIIVHDQSGRPLHISSSESANGTVILNLGGLSNGMYYISIHAANKIITKKIILAR